MKAFPLHAAFARLSKSLFQVTWIRRKDRQLLTVGRGTHAIDTRFVVVSNSPDWTLLIKNVKHEDAGLYECQVMRKMRVTKLIRILQPSERISR